MSAARVPDSGEGNAPAVHIPIWLLTLIALGGPLAMYSFLPAMPDAARDLAVDAVAIQRALGIYVIGMAAGHLVYGPLSDAAGRRPVLLAGLALYVLGGLTAALAPGLSTFYLGRFLQAFGGCAGLSLARAIVRDRVSAEGSMRMLALLNLFVSVSPGIGPSVGGLVSSLWGWRAVLLLLTAIGAFTAVYTWRVLPETAKARRAVALPALLRQYAELLGTPRFLAYALGGACATSAFYSVVSVAPFVLVERLGQPVALAGLLTGVIVFGLVPGNAMAVFGARRFGPTRIMLAGCAICIACALVLFAVIWLDRLNTPLLVGCMTAFLFASGMLNPAAMAKTLHVPDPLIGTASGLWGAFQQLGAGVCTVLPTLATDPVRAAPVVLLAYSLVGVGGYLLGRRLERMA